MNANPVLLQKKYARVVEQFASNVHTDLDNALNIFYNSVLYDLMHEGISDMHCMSDEYLAEELAAEKGF